MMNILKIPEIISNEIRLNIFEWQEKSSFHILDLVCPVGEDVISEIEVCAGVPQMKSGLSQSTISLYIALMHSIELVISKRPGKLTYYSLNEKVLADF